MSTLTCFLAQNPKSISGIGPIASEDRRQGKLEWACGLYLCFLWDQGMATQQLESKADLRSWTKTGWCVSDEQKRTVMDGLNVEPWRRKVRTGRAPRSGSMPAQSECLGESLL